MRIWAHGAAQGVWNERRRSADGGSEEMCALKSASDVISLRVDMVVGCELSGRVARS